MNLQPPATELPASLPLLTSRGLQWMGWAVVALVLIGLGALVAVHYRYELKHAHLRHEMLARVLEDHATRTLDAASLAMGGVTASLAIGETPNSTGIARALQQTLTNHLQLRSLSLVDARGRVLAAAGEPGLGLVDLDALAPLPAAGPPVLGRMRPGRGLPPLEQAEPKPIGMPIWPLVQRVKSPGGADLFLVGLLNPDYFANFQDQTLNDARLAAALVQLDGQCVVAATESAAIGTGEALQPVPPEVAGKWDVGRASWLGWALNADDRVASFRVLRSYPLWVMVELKHREVLKETLFYVAGFAVGGGLSALLALFLSLYASRAQGARETERKALEQAQARLAERARELDGVFASVHEMLFRTDANGVVQLINAPWERATGRPATQAVGKALPELFSPASREAVQALLVPQASPALREAQVLIEGPPGQDQRLSRLEMSVVPLLDEGRLIGFAGSAVDVTELMHAQAQLQAQLAFNASVIESSPLPVVVRDTANRYVRVNQAWEVFTGRTRDLVIGTLASLAYPPEHAQVHERYDRELLERGQGEVRYEAKIFRADGRLRDIYVTKSLIADGQGKSVAILGAFMDISEIREAERMTRLARDSAEAASVAKTEFIANISHELRTPLQTILGFSELGSRRAQEHTRLAAMFSDIHRAGQRMLALVSDLLDLSKLERKGIELELMRQDLRPVVHDAIAELELLASARSVRLNLGPGVQALMVDADVLRLGQVLRNLLANAIRFSPPLESVEIEFVQREQAEGREIELHIADRGPGIPAAELESIFEAFVQSSQTKDGTGGTGLGLTISRRIIRAHGGRLWAANRPGGGAVFTVVLPASQENAGPPQVF